MVGIASPTWQGWYDPETGEAIHPDHQDYFQYNVFLDGWPEQGTWPDHVLFEQQAGEIYWLEICPYEFNYQGPGPDMWGWKNADLDSYPAPYTGQHFEDDAVWRVEDYWYELGEPSDVLVDSFWASSDGVSVVGGGTGWDNGTWYSYENTGWWNQWFYDHPYDPTRQKVIDVEFEVTGVTAAEPLEFVVNWSTAEWSLDGNPPGQPRVPPLPPLTPAEEDLYIGRSDPVEVIDVGGQYAFHYVIPEYNPEWVSVDITSAGSGGGGEQLDQYQELCETCEHVGPTYWNSWQEFVPTANNLTRVEVKIARTEGYPNAFPITMTIESPLGAVLTSATLDWWDVPELPWCNTDWVSFDVPDIGLTPGQQYYIVLYTTDNQLAYHWCALPWGDAYPPGDSNFGPDWDWTFRTYFDQAGEVLINGTITHQCFQSMDLAFVITGKEPSFKWEQLPDLSPTGLDVHASDAWPGALVLADDFQCTTPGPIEEIHVWGSWFDDLPPINDPARVDFLLSIHEDIPDPDGPGPLHSMPGDLRWMGWMFPGDFTVHLHQDGLEEGWYNPLTGLYDPFNDTECWEYVFHLDPADTFDQEGTPGQPVTYWLDLEAQPHDWNHMFGWKTSLDHWNDDAVWGEGWDPPPEWYELRYPPGHQYAGQSIDLAFSIVGGAGGGSPPPLPPPYPHNRKKNRYISFDPNKAGNDGSNIAFKVELKSLWLGSCSATGVECRLDKNECSVSATSCQVDADCPGGEICQSPDCGRCAISGEPCNYFGRLCVLPGDFCIIPNGDICVNDQAGSVGMSWWVGPEHPTLANDVHLLVRQSDRKVSTNWPPVVHAADCEVVPVATYGVRAVDVSSGAESTELVVHTIDKPNTYWADGVGPLGKYCTGNWAVCVTNAQCPVGEFCIDQWPPPDGFTNFNDVAAAVFRFMSLPGFTVPDIPWVDMYGVGTGDFRVDPPDYVINFSDIQQIVLAFQGWPYLCSDPGDCPTGVSTWPP